MYTKTSKPFFVPKKDFHMRLLKPLFGLASIALGLTTIVSPAQAEEIDVDSLIIGCGIPQSVSVATNPNIPVCDIYTRQLAYRLERLKLRDQLNERQKNFAAPSIEAYNRYVENLEALNEERSEKENEDKKKKAEKSEISEEVAEANTAEKAPSE